MPHEGDDSMTDEFVNQLSVIGSLRTLSGEHATKDISAEQEQLVALLRECIMIRDNVLLCLIFTL